MIPPITQEEADEMILRATAKARAAPPPHMDVRPPIDLERLRPLCIGPIYEGFEEDMMRARKGLPPLGRGLPLPESER